MNKLEKKHLNNKIVEFRQLIYVFCIYLFVLNIVSTIFQLYRGGQFYWWKKPETPEKTTNLPQVTDKSVTKYCTPHPDRDSNSQHQW